jgi:hypothetical protein
MKHWQMIIAITVLFLSGCTHLGPKTIPRDRFDYNTAMANSWKEQTLLNIIKIRYVDMPVFVDVASIVSGYTLEGSVNLSGTFFEKNASPGDFLSLGTATKFIDRPTITYVPITGQQFNKSFMTPIPPVAILFLVQSGWPADLIYKVTVDSVNGLQGRVSAGSNARKGDPRFFRMVELMRKIQKSGLVGMRINKDKDDRESTLMFFYQENISPEISNTLDELGTLLGLRKGLGEIKVEYGLIPKDDTEITMLTRSMLQIMIELAAQVTVPQEHIDEHRTVPSIQGTGDDYLVRINHSKEKPENGFVAVRYRDYWFYIDDRDLISKRTFAFLMILFSVMETGGREGLPLVTIPAG